MHIQLHVTAPTDDPGPNAIDPNQGDLTNDQSPFLGAHVIADPQDETVVHPDHALPPEDPLLPGMLHVSQAGLRPSPCAQRLHNVEKYDIVYKMITHHRNKLTRQPLFNPHRVNTTHNNLSTTPTHKHNHTTTTNRPPTSGNPGDNGKTTPSPQTHPMPQSVLTTPNHQPVSATLMTPLPNHSRHSHPTTPHLSSPDEETLTHIRFRPIPRPSQCPSRTCCHQPSRWFQGRVGSKHQICLESS